MYTYHLQDEFTDTAAERMLLAALASKPVLYFEFLDLLSPGMFTDTADIWHQLTLAIETAQQPTVPADWQPASDPHETVHRLADLHQRRLLAVAQERLGQALFDDTISATALATLLEGEVLRVQSTIRETAASRLQWASDLLPEVLADAAARHRQHAETGQPVLGLQTGIGELDTVLNGLNAGLLHFLGGAPGLGKTTLALQIAAHVAPTAPVMFITFENAPANLTLKALCTRAGVNPHAIQRGTANPEVLREAAWAWQPIAQRLALIEGTSQLTVAQVRAKALQAMKHHQATMPSHCGLLTTLSKAVWRVPKRVTRPRTR